MGGQIAMINILLDLILADGGSIRVFDTDFAVQPVSTPYVRLAAALTT